MCSLHFGRHPRVAQTLRECRTEYQPILLSTSKPRSLGSYESQADRDGTNAEARLGEDKPALGKLLPDL